MRPTQTHRPFQAVLLLLLFLALPAPAQERPPRYKKNFNLGNRITDFTCLAFSPLDQGIIYLGSQTGYTFASNDGGLSWEEFRIIVQTDPFFGAIRPSPAATGVGVSLQNMFKNKAKRIYPGFSTGDLLTFSYGSAGGAEFLEESLYPSAYDKARLPGMPDPGILYARDTGGGLGWGGDASRLGVGIKSSAPYLQALLRLWKMPIANMTIKNLLATRGVEPTWIGKISASPDNRLVAITATSMGLFFTTDGGISWDLMYGGSNEEERDSWAAEYDPFNGKRILLGTKKGLLISEDRGLRFNLVTGTQLSGEKITYIHFDPARDGRILVGTDNGAFESRDHGSTWRWIFFETLPLANQVNWIGTDSQNEKVIYLATGDGLFKTANQGFTWDMAGPLMFTGEWVMALQVDPRDGAHVFAATDRAVWETWDGGATWSDVYIDNGEWLIRVLFLDRNDPDILWVLTTSELLRISPYPEQTEPQAFDRLKQRFQDYSRRFPEPGLSKVMDRAFRHLEVHTGERMEYRRKHTASALLPLVSLELGMMDPRGDGFIQVVPWAEAAGLDLNRVYLAHGEQFHFWGVLNLSWNLGNATFHRDVLPFGRVFNQDNMIYLTVKYEVARLYEERQRVRLMLLEETPRALVDQLKLELRYEEITQYLNVYTGGMFQKELDVLSQQGFVP